LLANTGRTHDVAFASLKVYVPIAEGQRVFVEIKTDDRRILGCLLTVFAQVHGNVHLSLIERDGVVKAMACRAPTRTGDAPELAAPLPEARR
jgi:hypothetical protein